MDKNPKQKNKRAKQKANKHAKTKIALASVAVLTCGAMLFTGCGNANNANAAARMSGKTAKRADNIVKKMDTYQDTHYKFPNSFGNDFFVKSHDYNNDFYFRSETTAQKKYDGKQKKTFTSRTKTKKHSPNMVGAFARKNTNNKKASNKAPMSVNNGPYTARHFTSEQLNPNNTTKKAYLDRYNDLYMLCADISAANAKQHRLIQDIRNETTNLRHGAASMYGNRTKRDFTEFNKAHEETQKAMTALYRDRSSVGKGIRMLPKRTDNASHESLCMRYQVIMNKLDSRIEKLERTKDGLARMNKAIGHNNTYNNNINQRAPMYQNYQNETTKYHLNKLPSEYNPHFPKPMQTPAINHQEPSQVMTPSRNITPHPMPQVTPVNTTPTVTPRYQQAVTLPYFFNEQEKANLNTVQAPSTPTTMPQLDDVPKKTMEARPEVEVKTAEQIPSLQHYFQPQRVRVQRAERQTPQPQHQQLQQECC